MGGIGPEKWNGVVSGGGGSFKPSDAGRNVFNEVVIGHIAFRRRGLGGPRRTTVGRKGTRGGEKGGGVTKWSGVRGGSSGKGKRGGPRRGEKSGKNMVAIVDSGSEGGVLNFGEEKGRGERVDQVERD